MTSSVLELRNVSKSFGDLRAVDDLSLSISPGSVYGFLGPNGAGKTTTIRMILDILKPSSGTITVLGQTSVSRVRGRLGYLPEEKGLYKKMRTWAVIAYFAILKGVDRQTARKRAFALLEQYGLKDFANARTEALSKGMAQKVQVLSAIAHDPELVILDEPFSGLDPVNQQVMEELVRDLAARGRTILFSTHVMQHAERLCTRIVIIAKGRKLFDGDLADARRTLPRRVSVGTVDDPTPLRQVSGVLSLKKAPGNLPQDGLAQTWDLEVHERADPQAILQACFTYGVRLSSFQCSEPTLHDVFVHLVGAEAKEVTIQ